MLESSDLRMTRIPLNHGGGHIPALGFGTLIPGAAVTVTATRDALEAGVSTLRYKVVEHESSPRARRTGF